MITKMDPNCKTKFNLDHVYCHTNESNYIRANSSGSAADVLAILKENKQLKSMLLLHLDLIQEQSDQLMAKDKLLASLRQENESLNLRLERMDRRIQLKCTKNNIESANPVIVNNNEDKKENIPEILKISPHLSPTVNLSTKLPSPPILLTASLPSGASKYKICDDSFNNDSIIGENNGKFISKIILQRVQISDLALKQETNIQVDSPSPKLEDNLQNSNNNITLVTNQDSVEESLLTKEVHIKEDTEDSFSCGSGDHDRLMQDLNQPQKNFKRSGFMTTKHLYCAREWETEKIDEEINKEETEALKADTPNLEIPKWTIKDFTGLYSIEGTEDLSDETFLKRHAKLEHDEKRRKKWDVQRIREQRTIERLKRRHCKDEIQETDNNQEITSFYPSPESIKFIQLTEDIPVQAFGESVPRIPSIHFSLPWHNNLSGGRPGILHPADNISQPTQLVFLKKRRRQYSQNMPSTSRGNPTSNTNLKRSISRAVNQK